MKTTDKTYGLPQSLIDSVSSMYAPKRVEEEMVKSKTSLNEASNDSPHHEPMPELKHEFGFKHEHEYDEPVTQHYYTHKAGHADAEGIHKKLEKAGWKHDDRDSDNEHNYYMYSHQDPKKKNWQATLIHKVNGPAGVKVVGVQFTHHPG